MSQPRRNQRLAGRLVEHSQSMPPRRSARLAAQRASQECVRLDDGDVESVESGSFLCAVCGDPGATIHIPCCSFGAHRDCVDDGVDAICPFCDRDVRNVVDAAAVQVIPDPQFADCTLCCECMAPENSIVVPCCQQRLHVRCLANSFTACGLRCPACNQDLSDFAASGEFQASAIFHECIVDVDSPPPNRGINSMVVPQGFPSPPEGFSLLCCHRTV